MSNYTRRPIFASDLSREEVFGGAYDLLLVALGFEARSSHLAKSMRQDASTRVALGFCSHHVHSYDSNRKDLVRLGFEIVELHESDVLEWWKLVLEKMLTGYSRERTTPLRICIDVSSLTRIRMANLLEGLVTTQVNDRPIEVDFVYTVAAFTKPSTNSEFATVCGPVSPFLAGWPVDPEQPVAALIGLGYELEKAVGALEYLEPTVQILLRPISKDSRFDEEVDAANESLLHGGPSCELFSYPIDKPTQCLELIDALNYRLSSDFRVIAIPFGPKIFALCCMLVACRYYPTLGIWRISAENAEETKDQLPSETTIGLRVRFDLSQAMDQEGAAGLFPHD